MPLRERFHPSLLTVRTFLVCWPQLELDSLTLAVWLWFSMHQATARCINTLLSKGPWIKHNSLIKMLTTPPENIITVCNVFVLTLTTLNNYIYNEKPRKKHVKALCFFALILIQKHIFIGWVTSLSSWSFPQEKKMSSFRFLCVWELLIIF